MLTVSEITKIFEENGITIFKFMEYPENSGLVVVAWLEDEEIHFHSCRKD